MNAVNRVAAVVLLLVVMLLCTTALVVPTWVFDAVARQAAALVDFLNSLRWYVRLPLGILFALALDIVCVLLIIFEIRRPPSRPIRVQKAAGGEVMVSVASIADRLRYEVDQLPSVLRTKPQVTGRRGGVAVELDVETATGINVPDKAAQIVELARQVVEDKMGLKLARPPKVNLRAVPYPRVPKEPTAPRPSVSPVVPDWEEAEETEEPGNGDESVSPQDEWVA